MSVVPQPWPQPAPQVAADIASMYQGERERPLPVLVHDKLGGWLADEQFAGAYGVRGKPGWPPSPRPGDDLPEGGEPHRLSGRRVGAHPDRLEVRAGPGRWRPGL